jgi:F-type H+-transporting ATPase subunit a
VDALLLLAAGGEKGDWMVSHLTGIHALEVLGTIGISTHALGLMFVAVALIATFLPFGRALQADPVVPRGRLVNLLEAILLFIRDEVSRPFLGKDGDRFLPVLWTLFFYILYCNLLGLMPLPLPVPIAHHGATEWHWFGTTTPTGQIAVTGALAAIAGLWWHGLGIKAYGLVGHIKNSVVPGGVPWWLLPVMILIEALGHVIKIVALAVRLWANMMGGHTVLYVVLGMIFLFGFVAAPFAVVAAAAIYLLEIFVAFLQAYVFTFLVVVFLGMSIHPEH